MPNDWNSTSHQRFEFLKRAKRLALLHPFHGLYCTLQVLQSTLCIPNLANGNLVTAYVEPGRKFRSGSRCSKGTNLSFVVLRPGDDIRARRRSEPADLCYAHDAVENTQVVVHFGTPRKSKDRVEPSTFRMDCCPWLAA